MIITPILHGREQAQKKVSKPSKHQECLNQSHREVPATPPLLPLLSPSSHEKSLLFSSFFSKAKGNSDQVCKVVAKEMRALGIPRVPSGNF